MITGLAFDYIGLTLTVLLDTELVPLGTGLFLRDFGLVQGYIGLTLDFHINLFQKCWEDDLPWRQDNIALQDTELVLLDIGLVLATCRGSRT